jgi:hypothetical protein
MQTLPLKMMKLIVVIFGLMVKILINVKEKVLNVMGKFVISKIVPILIVYNMDQREKEEIERINAQAGKVLLALIIILFGSMLLANLYNYIWK